MRRRIVSANAINKGANAIGGVGGGKEEGLFKQHH